MVGEERVLSWGSGARGLNPWTCSWMVAALTVGKVRSEPAKEENAVMRQLPWRRSARAALLLRSKQGRTLLPACPAQLSSHACYPQADSEGGRSMCWAGHLQARCCPWSHTEASQQGKAGEGQRGGSAGKKASSPLKKTGKAK